MNIPLLSIPSRSAKRRWLLFACLFAGVQSWGTGIDFNPSEFLSEGGRRVDASPEFYWDEELKRLAKDFQAPEKRVLPPPQAPEKSGEENALAELRRDFTSQADLHDFAEALKAGRIKPPNAEEASEQHEDARDTIDATTADTTEKLPPEFDSEFADYHRGAFAFARGQPQWEEARTEWKKLLARPKEQRQDRTVWATFMLGKIAMKSGAYDEAIALFQQTRSLAREGFVDSLGMAADSYGWEGRCEWKAGRPAKAAPLFLTQLALGDQSAVVSLKALIPDRQPVEGWLSYGPDLDDLEKRTDAEKKAADRETQQKLAACARDPLLRRLVTVHILATATMRSYEPEDSKTALARGTHWLAAISALKLKSVQDAEYLGWAAYNVGDYPGAQRWLALAEKADAPAASWLRAKLQRRAGKLADAAQSMQQAWRALADPSGYYGWEAPQDPNNPDDWIYKSQAGGDLAALHLARADFLQAFEIFRQAGQDGDAAYMAERVLTADELKKVVDQLPPKKADEPEKEDGQPWLFGPADWRYVLGRRLVREDRYEEAANYLPKPYAKVLAIYVKALRDGANEKLPPATRASAWSRAAYIARHDGMELMGTQEAPDGFRTRGNFPATEIASERLQGKFARYDENAKPLAKPVPVVPKPTKEELQRLTKNKIQPDVRYHYRVIAAALAMKAAKLLPDNSEELADVINTAGQWVKDRDEKAADKYYAEIAKRCPATRIGQLVLKQKWFVDEGGPWSERAQKEHETILKEAGLERSQP
jgi:hypothetical protein